MESRRAAEAARDCTCDSVNYHRESEIRRLRIRGVCRIMDLSVVYVR